jgi:hypothetical protein
MSRRQARPGSSSSLSCRSVEERVHERLLRGIAVARPAVTFDGELEDFGVVLERVVQDAAEDLQPGVGGDDTATRITLVLCVSVIGGPNVKG